MYKKKKSIGSKKNENLSLEWLIDLDFWLPSARNEYIAFLFFIQTAPH